MQRGAPVETGRRPRNCADAKYLAVVWAERAYRSRQLTLMYRKEMSKRTLRDFEVKPGNQAWHRAVREVQKVYPGTESWLLSCSAAEGGHGRWVTYGGGSDWRGAMANYVVGGWMQFKYPTFAGMYRHALEDVLRKGYRAPSTGLPEAWLSPLAQALAAGWARYTGNDSHHWSASFSNGC